MMPFKNMFREFEIKSRFFGGQGARGGAGLAHSLPQKIPLDSYLSGMR